MNDEGVGIAGWLLADLALVLAIVFLAFTPAALSDDSDLPDPTPTAEPSVSAPVILDIGCKATDGVDGSIAIRCEPDVGGGEVESYRWEADRGSFSTSTRGHYAVAAFHEAGAVRLIVSNSGGDHRAAYPVLPTRVAIPEGSEVLTDFRFDQIVIEGARLGAVRWAHIKAAGVRENLIKRQEDEELGHDWSAADDVEEFLQTKLDEGLRIALVETFAHEGNQRDVALAAEVNDVFHAGLLAAGMADIFLDCEAPRENWFVDYLNRSDRFKKGEVRINVFFVRPRDNTGCP